MVVGFRLSDCLRVHDFGNRGTPHREHPRQRDLLVVNLVWEFDAEHVRIARNRRECVVQRVPRLREVAVNRDTRNHKAVDAREHRVRVLPLHVRLLDRVQVIAHEDVEVTARVR